MNDSNINQMWNMTIPYNATNIANATYPEVYRPVHTMLNEITRWIAVVMFVGIVTLNSLVAVLLFLRKKKSRMVFFVTNLAIADLCVGVIYVLPELIIYRFNVGWEKYACYILFGMKMLPIYASTFSIVVLTIDRMYAIIKPLNSAVKGLLYRFSLVATTWLLACLLTIPYFLHVTFTSDGLHGCYFKAPSEARKVVVMFDASVNLIIPVIIIVSCYMCIIITMRRREQNVLFSEKSRTDKQGTTTISYRKEKARKPRIIKRAKIRTIKLLLVVVIAYIVCWTPVIIAVTLGIWNIIHPGTTTYQILFVLAPLNSMVNPIVFLLFNRKMFKRKNVHEKTLTALRTLTTSSFIDRFSLKR